MGEGLTLMTRRSIPVIHSSDWAEYLTLLARDLSEARGEEVQLKQAVLQARVNVIADNLPQRWQYDNALAATTQELTAELYTLQAEIADLLDALNLGKVLLQRDVPFLPMLDLRPTR